MTPERPFPALFETGKSYPKTGLLPAVLPTVFRAVFRAVFRQFSGGFPGGFPAVFRQFSGGFADSFPAVCRRRALPETTPVRLRPLPFIRKKLSAIPYTLSGVQTQHSGIFESVFVTKRLAKRAAMTSGHLAGSVRVEPLTGRCASVHWSRCAQLQACICTNAPELTLSAGEPTISKSATINRSKGCPNQQGAGTGARGGTVSEAFPTMWRRTPY